MSKLMRALVTAVVAASVAGCVYGKFDDVDFRGYACESDEECPDDLACLAGICADPFVVEGEGEVGEGEGEGDVG